MTVATKWAGAAAACALLAGGWGSWVLLQSARPASGHTSAPLPQGAPHSARPTAESIPLGGAASHRSVAAPTRGAAFRGGAALKGGALATSPSIASVSGQVLLPSDQARGVVALFSLDEDGVPSGDAEVLGTWDGEGRFRLESANAGTYVLCALAQTGSPPGAGYLRPVTKACTLALGQETSLEPIQLRPGEVIAGRVAWAGGRPVHPGRVAVSLGAGNGDLRRSLAEAELEWTRAAFELAELEVELGQDGTFRVAGLDRRGYALHPHHTVSESAPIPLTRVGTEPVPIEVQAPAAAVELVLGQEPIRFRVFGRGAPLQCSVAVVAGQSTWSMHTSDDGQFDLVPAPDAPTEIEFSQAEYVPRRLVIEPYEWIPGAVIDVHLDLGPLPASLVLELAPEVAERLGDRPVDLYLFALDDEEGREAASEWTGTPLTSGDHSGGAWICPGTDMYREIQREGGELHVAGLRPGRYEVHAYPRYLRRDGLGPPWLEETFEIELGPGERARRALAPELGGRLAVVLRGEVSVGSARFELLGPDGSPLPARYARFDFETGARSVSSEPRPGRNQVLRPLRPGFYRLRILVDDRERLDRLIEIGVDRVEEIVIDLSAI